MPADPLHVGDGELSDAAIPAGDAARRLRRRRVATVIVAVVAQVAIIAAVLTSHHGVHLAESALFPGAGLFESHRWLAIGFAGATIAATVVWMAWGAEWLIAALWVSSLLATLAWATPRHDEVALPGPSVARSAHEFPLVIAVVAAIGWVRGVLWHLPGVAQLARRPPASPPAGGPTGARPRGHLPGRLDRRPGRRVRRSVRNRAERRRRPRSGTEPPARGRAGAASRSAGRRRRPLALARRPAPS